MSQATRSTMKVMRGKVSLGSRPTASPYVESLRAIAVRCSPSSGRAGDTTTEQSVASGATA